MQTVKIPTFQRKTDPITMYYASIVLAMWNNDLMRNKLRTSFPAYNPCLGKQKTNNLIAKTQARTINCVCWINYAATLRKFSVFLPVRNLHLHIRRCFCLQKRKRGDEYGQDLHYTREGGGVGGGCKTKFALRIPTNYSTIWSQPTSL